MYHGIQNNRNALRAQVMAFEPRPKPAPETAASEGGRRPSDPVRPARWSPRGGWVQRAKYQAPFALLGDKIDYGYEVAPDVATLPTFPATVPTYTPSPTPSYTLAESTPWWQNILNTLTGSAQKIIVSKANTAVAVNAARDISTMNRYGYNLPLPGQSSVSTPMLLAGLALVGGVLFLSRK